MTEGQLGALPEWYELICAARYLGVPPWDLLERPCAWMRMALMAQSAEIEAKAEVAKRSR